MEQSTARTVDIVLVIRTTDPVRLREEIDAHDWQMPLAPFVADAETLAIVRVRARRRTRHEWKPAPLYGGQHGNEDRTEA